jgi:hypothetical protein
LRNRSHNRSIVSYDLKEKQSLNGKFDDAKKRKFEKGVKNIVDMAKETVATVVIKPQISCKSCGRPLKWHQLTAEQGEVICECGYHLTSQRRTCPKCGQPMSFLKAVGRDGDFGGGTWVCRDEDGCGYRY